jgi:hypothetical protein
MLTAAQRNNRRKHAKRRRQKEGDAEDAARKIQVMYRRWKFMRTFPFKTGEKMRRLPELRMCVRGHFAEWSKVGASGLEYVIQGKLHGGICSTSIVLLDVVEPYTGNRYVFTTSGSVYRLGSSSWLTIMEEKCYADKKFVVHLNKEHKSS